MQYFFLSNLEMGECVVCYNATDKVTWPCNHQVCDECLSRWLMKQNTCPYCRQNIGQCNFVEANSDEFETYTIDLTNEKHAGITVDYRGSNVVVTKLNPADECYKSGIRKNMSIHYINNIHIRTPREATDVIEATMRGNGCAIVLVKRRKRGLQMCMW